MTHISSIAEIGINEITVHDLSLFEDEIMAMALELIPTAREIVFYNDVSKPISDDVLDKNLRKQLVGNVEKGVAPQPVIEGNVVYLPLTIHSEAGIVLCAEGIDPLLAQKADPAWLVECAEALLYKLELLKSFHVDPRSGLYNQQALVKNLRQSQNEGEMALILIEPYPYSTNSYSAGQHLQQVTSLLRSFLGKKFPLFYLDSFVFGCLCQAEASRFAGKVAATIPPLFKKESVSRVRVGWSRVTDNGKSNDREGGAPAILEEAYLALHQAYRRGPYGTCSYDSLRHPESHPLAPVSKSTRSRLQRLWRGCHCFTLAMMLPDDHGERIIEGEGIFDEPVIYQAGEGREGYYFFPDYTPVEARELLYKSLVELKVKNKLAKGLSIGLCSYPFYDFRPTELIGNCRKALLHGALLGKEQLTIFDALSLNVSGDIYFSEGDFPKAIREYRQGLVLQPDDENILNSLGVGYATMNRHRLANECFDRVLEKNPDNFMALYNFGLGRELLGDNQEAISLFERAIAILDEQGGAGVNSDLSIQLGRLYCRTGLYRACLDLLIPWYKAAGNLPGSGRALRYIGIACSRLGQYDDASIWFQRSLRFDSNDPEVLSLLAISYVECQQGNDIALSLGRKAAELQPDNLEIQCRLASIFIHCDMLDQGAELLQKCLRYKKVRDCARLQMGILQRKQGRLKSAMRWFEKVTTTPEPDHELRRLAEKELTLVSKS
ncbi:MAG: tetratricopeptide repeat protein [Thermodesulfobacteriota bacterium]